MKLNHDRRGSGTPLVLIHGIGHRWQAWLPILPILERHHEVIAIDLPGFGASPAPRDRATLKDIHASAHSLAEQLAGMGIANPHVAGYSLGGAISLEMAAAGLCASATAFSPAGFFTEPQRRRALRTLKMLRATTFAPAPLIRTTMASPRFRHMCFRTLVVHTDRINAQVAFDDAISMRRGRGFRTVANASRAYSFESPIKVPTTVAWAEKDRILPVAQAAIAKTRLPGVRHLVMPDCGHVPMSDNPELVATTILETTALAV